VKRRLPLAMWLVLLSMLQAAAAAQTRPFDSPAILSASNMGLAQGRPAGAGSREVAAGQQIFDAQCAWCHGNGGDGGTGPNLHGRLRHATTRDSIVEIILNGIPGTDMPSFRSGLTERAMRQTATYVQSLSRATSRPGPGNAKQGAALYQSAGCRSCHVVDGGGGILGPELTSIGARRGPAYLRDAIVKPAAAHPTGYLVVRAVPNSGAEIRGIRVNEDVFWIHIRDAGGTLHTLQKSDLSRVDRELEGTLMPSYASQLSAAELDDLVAYLATLRGMK
jgi:cytochrome c oxidase cbb3-type subunit 3